MDEKEKDEPRIRGYPKLSFGNVLKPGTSGKAMLAIFFATLVMLALGIAVVLLRHH